MTLIHSLEAIVPKRGNGFFVLKTKIRLFKLNKIADNKLFFKYLFISLFIPNGSAKGELSVLCCVILDFSPINCCYYSLTNTYRKI